MTSALLTVERKRFHSALLGSVLTSSKGVPSNADKGSKTSRALASHILRALGTHSKRPKLVGQRSGKQFEQHVHEFLGRTFLRLSRLRPGRWSVLRIGDGESAQTASSLADFEQYQHLAALNALMRDHPSIAAALGSDYLIAPDTVIVREPESDRDLNRPLLVVDGKSALRASLRRSYNPFAILHASISCKWTLRSDRAQNARSEALNLIRNRKGPLPHIAVVTGEPMPSRLASLALGTGDIDCVYHFALPELERAVNEVGTDDSREALRIMVDGRRLKDISDLPLDLAI